MDAAQYKIQNYICSNMIIHLPWFQAFLKTVLNELYFWTLSIVWCLKKIEE
jgi:hypothetical protein